LTKQQVEAECCNVTETMMTVIAKEIHGLATGMKPEATQIHVLLVLGLKPGHTAFGLKQHSLTACSSNVLI